ncbi:hypothetical protein Taro_008768, partial [Colocasia esculenta]|nr:hypothetical protein [Colocasia esculenta]
NTNAGTFGAGHSWPRVKLQSSPCLDLSRYRSLEVGFPEMATIPPAAATLLRSGPSCSVRRKAGVTYVGGLSSFGGLKAHNNVASLGLPDCADRSFAKVVAGLRSASRGTKGKGGALSSTCNAASEIFQIAAIMNGLVLVGVAVGFVILRVESSLEEAE